jgi:hypothetical protein
LLTFRGRAFAKTHDLEALAAARRIRKTVRAVLPKGLLRLMSAKRRRPKR